MTPFHVFGIQSRLGVPHPSVGQAQKRVGVEKGPEAIIDAFPEWFMENAEVDMLTLPEPEGLPQDKLLATVGAFSQQIRDTLLQYWKPGQTPIFVGGDHSISFSSLAAVTQRYQGKHVAVIQFDSHADLHLPATSPSQNFHGMWARATQTDFPLPEINGVITTKITPSQWYLVGNLVLEPEEVQYMSTREYKTLNTQDIQSDVSAHTQKLIDHIRIADHIHVSFDIDVFAAALVPGTGTPNPKGMTPSEVWPLIQTIRNTHQITGATLSLDLVEYNPQLDLQGKTLSVALEVLSRFFSV